MLKIISAHQHLWSSISQEIKRNSLQISYYVQGIYFPIPRIIDDITKKSNRRVIKIKSHNRYSYQDNIQDSNYYVAHLGPTWVLSAPGGSHIGPINLAIRDMSMELILYMRCLFVVFLVSEDIQQGNALICWLIWYTTTKIRLFIKVNLTSLFSCIWRIYPQQSNGTACYLRLWALWAVWTVIFIISLTSVIIVVIVIVIIFISIDIGLLNHCNVLLNIKIHMKKNYNIFLLSILHKL